MAAWSLEMRHSRASGGRRSPPVTRAVNTHKPKRVAAVVLLAGAALAGVVIKHRADEAERVRSLPVLADIPSSLDTSPGEGEVVRAYSVSGMCCESCTRKLHERIAGLDGVVACAVDLIEERLTVIARDDVASERILSTLSFDKYAAVELP